LYEYFKYIVGITHVHAQSGIPHRTQGSPHWTLWMFLDMTKSVGTYIAPAWRPVDLLLGDWVLRYLLAAWAIDWGDSAKARLVGALLGCRLDRTGPSDSARALELAILLVGRRAWSVSWS
jgi:hypothetical protein